MAVSWKAPNHLGQPVMHKYKLERQLLGGADGQDSGGKWVTADGDIDDEDMSVMDEGLQVLHCHGWLGTGYSIACPKCTSSMTCSSYGVEVCTTATLMSFLGKPLSNNSNKTPLTPDRAKVLNASPLEPFCIAYTSTESDLALPPTD